MESRYDAERKRKGKENLVDESDATDPDTCRRRKKKKKKWEGDEAVEGSGVDFSMETKKKKKKKKITDAKEERGEVERSESTEPKISRTKKKRIKGKAKKKLKKAARKIGREPELAKEKTPTLIVKQLTSSGKYQKSWFLQKKPMLSDLVITYYWAPSWYKPELKWYIHAGFPEKSSRDKERERAENKFFKKSFDPRHFEDNLAEDMDLYWPEHEEDFRLEEWRKHGRGTGMTPEEYFATVMDIHQAILNIVGEDGINLDSGVPIKARDAVESLKKKLGRVQISTFKSVEEEDTTNYIGELKIYIDKDSYGIGSRPNMSSYLGITSKDEVVLPKAPVKLKKKKDV
ncbi:hypothetical protein OROHE_004320 [Orobanche hederae]